MLRPATPLTVLLFVAFVLLLISVISTPIIKAIPLGSFDGIDFGVFGFCKGNDCSPIEVGYSFEKLYSDAQAATFDLPLGTKKTLTAILIVHPVAALFTLIMFILAAAAHFHSPSHSPRFLLGIFILSILTLILALLSFLIDVLLFVPHMSWGSYIVLAATILVAASGIISCAMRRTLVGRKARKRRIAENAEMNGENFYNRQAATPVAPTLSSNTMVNGGPGNDKLPDFATFDMAKKEEGRTSDERIPLTTRTTSETSPSNLPGGMGDGYGGQSGSPPRDQFGNPVRDQYGQPLNRQYSDNSMNSRSRGGMPPGGFRGRGGYPPNGRGGYGPGPGPGRGGYGPPRGGYGPSNGRGGYGPPGPYGRTPIGQGGMIRGGRGGPPPGYGAPPGGRGYERGPSPGGSYGPYGRRPSPQQLGPGYNQDTSPGGDQGEYALQNPGDNRYSLPRAESPPPMPGLDEPGPVGQAVEMDATTGSPSQTPKGFGTHFGQLRDSDGDVAGMVGLQQQRQRMRQETAMSEGSRFSGDVPYVPPRQGWGEARGTSPHPGQSPGVGTSGHRRVNSGDNYFEDVDPRFAEQPPPINTSLPPSHGGSNTNLTGLANHPREESGSRSPAESERSNFTSVSQRGVNPRWNPGPGGYGGPMPKRRPVNPPQRNEILLNSNPDFQLPGGPGGRNGSPARGLAGQGPYPGG